MEGTKGTVKQEMVLGIGGMRMLEALNFKISKYHMNEGQSSFLTLELMKKNGMDADRTKDLCIFTNSYASRSGL